MRTFGELLAEYMTRTGISDSELARTLGVRRQTIFRWKEGLVERPRRREDVLVCAKRLRLEPEERDELLLAAGFAPENPAAAARTDAPAPPGAPEAEAPAPVSTQPAPAAAPPSSPTHAERPRHLLSPRTLGLLALFALFVLGGGLFLAAQPRSTTAFPEASPGEELVILAPFESESLNVPVTPTPASRRLSGEEIAAGPGFTRRLQAALERELQAARLEHVRLAVWPEDITGAGAADAARQRARAALVVWGVPEGNAFAVMLSTSPAAARADDLPLEALVEYPMDARLIVSADSPEDVQVLSLLVLSQLYLDEGDFALARALLTSAFARSPAAPESQAALYAYMGYAYQLSKPPDLDSAVLLYGQAIDLVPGTASVHVNRGLAYVRQNASAQWQADFAGALAAKPDDAGVREALCRAYGLDKQPQEALSHCDAAVSRAATPRSRDARALVYAQLGRLSDAAADLKVFLEWLDRQPPGLKARYGSTRADWLKALEAGQNPIDQTVLDRLRQE